MTKSKKKKKGSAEQPAQRMPYTVGFGLSSRTQVLLAAMWVARPSEGMTNDYAPPRPLPESYVSGSQRYFQPEPVARIEAVFGPRVMPTSTPGAFDDFHRSRCPGICEIPGCTEGADEGHRCYKQCGHLQGHRLRCHLLTLPIEAVAGDPATHPVRADELHRRAQRLRFTWLKCACDNQVVRFRAAELARQNERREQLRAYGNLRTVCTNGGRTECPWSETLHRTLCEMSLPTLPGTIGLIAHHHLQPYLDVHAAMQAPPGEPLEVAATVPARHHGVVHPGPPADLEQRLEANAFEAVAAIDDPRGLPLADTLEVLYEAAEMPAAFVEVLYEAATIQRRNRASGFGDALESHDTEDASSSSSSSASPDPAEEAEEDETRRPDETDNDEAALLQTSMAEKIP